MRIQVTGKGLAVGKNLTHHITKSIESHIKKYFNHAINARVLMTKDRYNFHVDIFVNEGVKHGVFIKASADSQRAYDAVDHAITRINTKLRRYKNKIQDYNQPNIINASKYMIEQDLSEESSKLPSIEEQFNNPNNIEIQLLSVEEAIMHLEFSSAPALLFINVANRQLSMVYEEKDGAISVVEAPHRLDSTNTTK